MFPYEPTPEQKKKILIEKQILKEQFEKWIGAHGMFIPPAISEFAFLMYEASCRQYATLMESGREEEAGMEPIGALCSMLSFGVFLGKSGFAIENLTMPSLLTPTDERKLLGGDPERPEAG